MHIGTLAAGIEKWFEMGMSIGNNTFHCKRQDALIHKEGDGRN